MKRKTLFVMAMLILFTSALWAAEASGKWSAQVPGRSGQMRDVTFVLKASAENLTGTMSGRNGDVPISDGKVNGDDISFSFIFSYAGFWRQLRHAKIYWQGCRQRDQVQARRWSRPTN